jgi:hypothetical protein
LLPTVLSGCESWTLSETHEALLAGSERGICGAVQIDVVWRKRYNQELYTSFNDVDIIKIIKINR